uniref:Mediator of RNA polymerase II transcription subunit 23 n=2 Tax=Timema TaxID=61471 RepID=A0A7R9IVF8_TIMCA|nr:unnamed protein product [Timema californicum]
MFSESTVRLVQRENVPASGPDEYFSKEGVAEEATEGAIQGVAEEATECAIEGVTEEATEGAIEGVAEEATECAIEGVAEEATECAIEGVTEEATERKVEGIEEAFSCFLVHRPELEAEKIQNWQHELQTVFIATPSEHQEAGVRQYLVMAAGMTNSSRLKMLLSMLETLVLNNILPARMVCECILACEKLQYLQGDFWVECFNLIRRIIGGVDYKGVREIMKGCREKAQTIPSILNASVLPQLRALENVIEYIFDRNACLLPGYFIVNEIQKAYPDNKNWPHWKLAHLLSSFVESFRSTAQMVSIIGHSLKRPVVEHSGYADHLINPWKLDPATLKFSLKGNLPYDPELLKPQTGLLRYVLEQPYSRDMVCSMLGLQKQHKQRCVALEEQLVELVILAMERSETEADSEDVTNSHWLWLHLSSQLIYFVLFQFASFPNIVMALHEKLAGRDLRRGRDHMMWVLLQFISGSIQRNPLSNFLPVLKLYDLLYPEKEPLPVPDFNKALCTHQMAMTCIWIHLLKKAQSEHHNIHRPIPHTLKVHHEFLQHLVMPSNSNLCMGADYRIALLCNAYSTNQDYFSRPMAALVETILGTQKGPQQPPLPPLTNNAALANGPTTPLSMSILDSLTVHSKMSLIHSIVTHVIKLAQSKSNMALAPALVETYSRLLVYTEIESLGIKGFISQLLPTVFKSHAWGILYTLLEMFSYRMHHIQPHYRVQLLSHLHSLAAVPQTNQTQLHLCTYMSGSPKPSLPTKVTLKNSLRLFPGNFHVESTALRLITGLGSAEVQPQLSRFLSEPKTLVSAESEELNRALVLTLARSMHVTGTGCETLSGTWCKDLLNTIMQNTPHSWANHTLQCFPPVLNEFFQQNSVAKENKQQLKKAVEEEFRNWASMNNENDIIAHFSVPGTPPLFLCVVWKMILETDRISPIAYKILERIGARALSAHLRKFCDYLVFEFANSGGGQHVNKCVDAINDMIWKYNIVTIDRLVLCLALRTQEGSEAQVCFFIIQLLLLKAAEFRNRVQEFVKENSPEHWKQSNWCLTLFIHRYLELPPVTKSLETLLEHLGCLYKFHDRPVTYLYNTLHYYERKLRDRPPLKRRLVAAVLGSLRDIRAPGWSLSEPYQNYMQRQTDETTWVPELDYYIKLVKRIVDTMAGKPQFPSTDWRFNEFPNPAAHALYVTCVELMAVPVTPSLVGNNLLDVVAKGYTVIASNQIQLWINSVGLIMAALPDSYWSVLHDRLISILSCPQLSTWKYRNTPFQLFNFNITHNAMLENKFSYSLAFSTLYVAPCRGRTDIHSTTRFNTDRPRCVMELTVELYELLEQVDRNSVHMKYMDPICDLLYHIKYMFVGDMMKNDVECIIRKLRPALQMRLRFIAHLNIEEINAT